MYVQGDTMGTGPYQVLADTSTLFQSVRGAE